MRQVFELCTNRLEAIFFSKDDAVPKISKSSFKFSLIKSFSLCFRLFQFSFDPEKTAVFLDGVHSSLYHRPVTGFADEL